MASITEKIYVKILFTENTCAVPAYFANAYDIHVPSFLEQIVDFS